MLGILTVINSHVVIFCQFLPVVSPLGGRVVGTCLGLITELIKCVRLPIDL